MGLLLREIDISGCTWAMTPVLGDPNVTAFLKALSLHRFCSTCTPTTYQLHGAENSFTLTTYVSPFKANTSANWNAVSHQIWRGCHTSVDSGDLPPIFFYFATPTISPKLMELEAVILTKTFHQWPGPALGCQGTGQGLHSQGPGFEYKDQDKDKDLSKCGHISVNIPGI